MGQPWIRYLSARTFRKRTGQVRTSLGRRNDPWSDPCTDRFASCQTWRICLRIGKGSAGKTPPTRRCSISISVCSSGLIQWENEKCYGMCTTHRFIVPGWTRIVALSSPSWLPTERCRMWIVFRYDVMKITGRWMLAFSFIRHKSQYVPFLSAYLSKTCENVFAVKKRFARWKRIDKLWVLELKVILVKAVETKLRLLFDFNFFQLGTQSIGNSYEFSKAWKVTFLHMLQRFIVQTSKLKVHVGAFKLRKNEPHKFMIRRIYGWKMMAVQFDISRCTKWQSRWICHDMWWMER